MTQSIQIIGQTHFHSIIVLSNTSFVTPLTPLTPVASNTNMIPRRDLRSWHRKPHRNIHSRQSQNGWAYTHNIMLRNNTSISNCGNLHKLDNKFGNRRQVDRNHLTKHTFADMGNARKGATPTRKAKIVSEKKAIDHARMLEQKLKSIEANKKRQLQEVSDWKQTEMARIRTQFFTEHKACAQSMQDSAALDDKVARAKSIIAHLKRENKKLREKNRALRRAIDKMSHENNLLAAKSSGYSENTQTLTSNMKHLNDQKHQLLNILQQLKTHVEKFEEAIALRDDAVLCENKVGRLYLNAMREITLVVEESGDSEELIDEIDDCFLNAHNGRGLEETEREMSESVL